MAPFPSSSVDDYSTCYYAMELDRRTNTGVCAWPQSVFGARRAKQAWQERVQILKDEVNGFLMLSNSGHFGLQIRVNAA